MAALLRKMEPDGAPKSELREHKTTAALLKKMESDGTPKCKLLLKNPVSNDSVASTLSSNWH